MPTQKWYLTPLGYFGNLQITVELDPAEIVGWRGAFGSALLLPLKIAHSLTDDAEVRLHSLEGWIAWSSDSVVLSGIRIPSQTVSRNSERLVVPITEEHIAEIEKRRTGEAVVFRVALAGLATIPNPNHTAPQYTRQQDGKMAPGSVQFPEVHAVRQSHGDGGEFLRIEREHWLTILEQLGAGRRRLIELPEPTLPVGQAEWKACMRLLEEAAYLFRLGQYPHVVKNCRTIIEGVTDVLCAGYGIERDRTKPWMRFRDWSKGLPEHLTKLWTSDPSAGAVLYELLCAGWSWTSPSHHYGSGIPEREEVSFALSLATDLLVFGAQVLTAHGAPEADHM